METYFGVYVFLIGAIIGSFLNVVLYRMHTGRSLDGRSHCMSCGTTLTWYELVPVISYLALRARCRTCGAHIPARYLTVELLTGGMFVLIYAHVGALSGTFLWYALLAILLILVIGYDMRHTIIPDELVLLIGALALAALVMRYAGGEELSMLAFDVVAGLGAAGFFYLLWRVSRGRWIGLGDAKLALPLGVIAGSAGAFSMVVLSFWVGAAISLVLLAVRAILKQGTTALRIPIPQLTMKSEVPFAPFLVIGFILAHMYHVHVFALTEALLAW